MSRTKFHFVVIAAFTWLAADLNGWAAEPEWKPIFNGKSLDGWQPVGKGDNWSVVDGELRCTGKPGAQWIRTKRQYANFDLRLQYKMIKNGNSGVFIRAPEKGSPWIEGMEIQLLDDYGDKWPNLKPTQYTASIYGVVPPSTRATKPPGSWQSMRIQCVDRRVRIWVNDKQVIDANLANHQQHAKKVPGLKRKAGYIGLQDHGDAIAFRRIEIRELK